MSRTMSQRDAPSLMGNSAVITVPRTQLSLSLVASRPRSSSSQFGARTKKEITRLSTNIQSAQNSFNDVKKLIVKFSKGESSVVQERWQAISEHYTNALINCHDDASKASVTIKDFLENIIPYFLKNEDCREANLVHLEKYTKLLVKGALHSLDLANKFSNISREVESFAQKWQYDALLEASRPIQAKIDELQLNIQFFTKRVDGVFGSFVPLVASTEGIDKSAKNELRKMEQKYQQDEAAAKKMDPKVQKHAHNIESRTNAMADVWMSIRADIVSISHHLELCCSDGEGKIFEHRMKALHDQYAIMGLNFDTVEIATGEGPPSGFLQRLKRLLA